MSTNDNHKEVVQGKRLAKIIPSLRGLELPTIHPFLASDDEDTPKGFYLTERFWSRHGRRGPNT